MSIAAYFLADKSHPPSGTSSRTPPHSFENYSSHALVNRAAMPLSTSLPLLVAANIPPLGDVPLRLNPNLTLQGSANEG
jgi:hypothetical protein